MSKELQIKEDRPIQIGNFKIQQRGLTAMGKPTYDEWYQVGEHLRYLEGSLMWAIGDWLNYGEQKYGEMYAQATEDTGYSVDTCRHAKWVSGQFELCNRLHNVPWSFYQMVAAQLDDIRNALLSQAEQEEWTRKQLREAIRNLKNKPSPELPSGKYSVIYADPPWRYDFSASDSRQIENKYPTMELDAICNLPIVNIEADDCVLFLWATSPKLAEAMRVVEAWGFTYKTCAVWVKDKIGMGYYFRQRHELLLVATKGNPQPPPPSERPDSVMEYPRGEHSAKPTEVQDLIDGMYPDFSKVELFARNNTRKGWTAWGNQA